MTEENLVQDLDDHIRLVISFSICIILRLHTFWHCYIFGIQVAASLEALQEPLALQAAKVNQLARACEEHQTFLKAWNEFFKQGRTALNPSQETNMEIES